MENPTPKKRPLNKSRAFAFLPVLILVFSAPVRPLGANQDTGEVKIDYGMAKQDVLNFESVVNDVINSTFGSSPYAVLYKPKGAYLPGYGFSLSFTINIYRAVINTPFGQIRSRVDASPDLKKRRIDELKDKLIRALQENGDKFRQLRRDDNVTIVAFFEDRNFPDEPDGNKTMILSALKKDLDELGHKIDRSKEFRQRMKIVEY